MYTTNDQSLYTVSHENVPLFTTVTLALCFFCVIENMNEYPTVA